MRFLTESCNFLRGRISVEFAVHYHTSRKHTATITIPCSLNEQEYDINGKQLASALIQEVSGQQVPVGYCIAFWDAYGRLCIAAQRVESGKWVHRLSEEELVRLDVPEIKAMVLDWHENAAKLYTDTMFEVPRFAPAF